MPLEECRTCGNPVDLNAEICPRCGATNPGQGVKSMISGCFTLIKLGAVLFVLIIVVGIIGSTCDQLLF